MVAGRSRRGGGLCQAPQDRLQNAPVAEVVDFDRAVDARDGLELDDIPIWTGCLDLDPLPRRDVLQTEDIEGLFAGQSKQRRVLTRQELQRQDPHTDQIRAVDALETLDEDGLDSQQEG